MNRYFYVKNGSCGMDKYGRWTDNPANWHVMSKADVLKMADDYRHVGATLGVL